jgi:hypothetical protein
MLNVQKWMVGLLAGATAAAGAQQCSSSSALKPMAVVELYTSQGCSSCPPADRWLSSLRVRDDVLALSFHVNYWNYLGWKDPFATELTTQRQKLVKTALNTDYLYTPQVIVNGQEEKEWSQRQASDVRPLQTKSAPAVTLQRQGDVLSAQVGASAPGAPSRWAGYWVVLKDGQRTDIAAGENAGRQLRNDHVVVLYEPVAAWSSSQPQQFRLQSPLASGHRAAFVVTQANGISPVQATVLACGAPS